MLAGDRLTNDSGNEVCLFPLSYMYITTARDPAEHQVLALDFLGWGPNGRVYNCPAYAPYSGLIVYAGNDHNEIFWSDNPVQFADGSVDYASILVAHSELDTPQVGRHYNQGDLWYHSGNYGNSTGDHLHFEIAKGHVKWNSSGTALSNPSHVYDCCYVNNTILARPLSYPWRVFEGGVTPPPTPTNRFSRSSFPFYLYRRKRMFDIF